MRFRIAAHPGFGNDERKLGNAQIVADIADEVGQIRFILVVVPLVDTVVPSLMPAEAHEFVPLVVIAGKLSRQIVQDVIDVAENFTVVGPHAGTSRTGGAEVDGQTLAAPGRLDQQDLLVIEIADHVAEPQLGSDHITGAEADRKVPLFTTVGCGPYPDVVAHDPLTLRVHQMAIVPRITVDLIPQAPDGPRHVAVARFRLALALHVRLAGKDEDLNGQVRPGVTAKKRDRRRDEHQFACMAH